MVATIAGTILAPGVRYGGYMVLVGWELVVFGGIGSGILYIG